MPTVTLKTIAKKCGVSEAAVSRVLNNKGDWESKGTKEKILAAAKSLNYRPNYFARSLTQGRTNCIGLMGSLNFAHLNYPYNSDLAASVEDALATLSSDYSLNLFGANHNQTYEKSIELIKKGMVDGLLLIVLSGDLPMFEEKMKPILDECRVPFVVMHSLSRDLPFNNVGVDSSRAGYLAAEHLVSRGYRDIGFYSIYTHTPQIQEVINGFKKGLEDNGRAWDDKMVLKPVAGQPDGNSYSTIYRTIMEMKNPPRAIFAPTETQAIGIYQALQDRRVKIPEETALVLFNDALPVMYFEDKITAVRHPIKEKAQAAVTMLLDILSGKKSRERVYQETMKPWLEVRKST